MVMLYFKSLPHAPDSCNRKCILEVKFEAADEILKKKETSTYLWYCTPVKYQNQMHRIKVTLSKLKWDKYLLSVLCLEVCSKTLFFFVHSNVKSTVWATMCIIQHWSFTRTNRSSSEFPNRWGIKNCSKNVPGEHITLKSVYSKKYLTDNGSRYM